MPDRSFLSWPFFEDSHRQFAKELATWANENVRSAHSTDVDKECRNLVRRLGNAGWLKHLVPPAEGGAPTNLEARNLCLAREILAYHSGLADFCFAMQGLGSGPITLFGSADLKNKYLPRIVSGEIVGAFAISEAAAGSDLRGMQSSARREQNDYVLNGEKTWISNAGLADLYVTFCRFPQGGDKSFIAVAIPADAPGLTVERIEIVAPHPIGTVRFQNCRVPHTMRIGNEGDGLKVALGTLDVFRSSVGAAALGFARRAMDEAVSFSQERTAFGQKLSEFQITQAKFADMALAIEASALLVYRAAWTHDVLRQRVTREAAMAKLHATEAAQQVIDQAVQILGARGVVAGSITERLYREVRALRIYEGTSEIQKLIIAGQVLKAAGEAHAG